MQQLNPNQPAFPAPYGCNSNEKNRAGLTVKEEMVKAFVAGLLASNTNTIEYLTKYDNGGLKSLVNVAILTADITIDKLNNPQKEKKSDM